MERLKRISFCALSIMLASTVMAQEKKSFTLDDLIPGGSTYHQFVPDNLHALQWRGENAAWYDIDKETMAQTAAGNKQKNLSLSEINKALEAAGLKTVNNLYQLSFVDENEVLLKTPSYYALYKEGSINRHIDIEPDWNNKDFALPSRTLAFTHNNNLWIANADGKKPVTNEPEGVVCGQSVHRNEFGIRKGTFWSPDGSQLAFYRMDERMVTDYPIVDISSRIASLKNKKYPMAGMTSHRVTIGIYSLSTGKTVYLNTDDPTDRYFTNIAWSPDGSKIYVIELNRDQNHAQLIRYNATTGEKEALLIEETNDKYVEPEHPILFVKGNDKQFIYQSQRDGYNHLYLYNADGKLIRQLTSGEWLVQQVLGFDEKGRFVYYMSTEESPLETHLYKVDIKNGKRTRLTLEPGLHSIKLSPSGRYAIDTYSNPDTPRAINVLNCNNGKVTNRLLSAANPYADYAMPHISIGSIKAADGVTDLYYRLTRPVDFDPNKKYPAVIYVYGGPHNQMVRKGFNANIRGWDIYMAQKGYVVFTLDNRGTMNRGFEFESATFRRLGVEEGKDQMEGVQFLKSLPYVDANRLGIHGWSFGGHMTTGLLLRYPGTFKAGVAGGPVIDWAYYEIMYGERYMGRPQTNSEGYEQTNLNQLAGNLTDRLLIIHDDEDDTCVPQHTLSFMKACVEAFTFPDLFIYPGHKHNVAGKDRVHLHEKITRYFEEHLK